MHNVTIPAPTVKVFLWRRHSLPNAKNSTLWGKLFTFCTGIPRRSHNHVT